MEMIPVTTDISDQNWLVLGESLRAEDYRRSLEAFGARLVNPPVATKYFNDSESVNRKLVPVEVWLEHNHLDGVICFDGSLLSPLQRDKIRKAGTLLWMADHPSQSTVVMPDKLNSHLVPVLLCVGVAPVGGARKLIRFWRFVTKLFGKWVAKRTIRRKKLSEDIKLDLN